MYRQRVGDDHLRPRWSSLFRRCGSRTKADGSGVKHEVINVTDLEKGSSTDYPDDSTVIDIFHVETKGLVAKGTAKILGGTPSLINTGIHDSSSAALLHSIPRKKSTLINRESMMEPTFSVEYADDLGSGIESLKRRSLVPRSSVIHVQQPTMSELDKVELSAELARLNTLPKPKRDRSTGPSNRRIPTQRKVQDAPNGELEPTIDTTSLNRKRTLPRSESASQPRQTSAAVETDPTLVVDAREHQRASSHPTADLLEIYCETSSPGSDADEEASDLDELVNRNASVATNRRRTKQSSRSREVCCAKEEVGSDDIGRAHTMGKWMGSSSGTKHASSGTESSEDDRLLCMSLDPAKRRNSRRRRGIDGSEVATRVPSRGRSSKNENHGDRSTGPYGILRGRQTNNCDQFETDPRVTRGANCDTSTSSVVVPSLNDSKLDGAPAYGNAALPPSILQRAQSNVDLRIKASIERQNAVRFLARSSSYRTIKMQEMRTTANGILPASDINSAQKETRETKKVGVIYQSVIASTTSDGVRLETALTGMSAVEQHGGESNKNMDTEAQ